MEVEKLVLNSLDLQIFLGDLFEKCEDGHEIMWLQDERREEL